MKLTKTHNCLENVRAEFKKDDPEIIAIRFDLATIQNIEHPNGIPKTGQRITIVMDKLKRNGTIKRVEVKTFIAHTYCPFCGGKY